MRLTRENNAEELAARASKIRQVNEYDEAWVNTTSQSLLLNGAASDSVFDVARIARNLRRAVCIDLGSYLCEPLEPRGALKHSK